jgi:hypothetical protein
LTRGEDRLLLSGFGGVAVAAGFPVPAFSSGPSASIVSSLDSTPATACWINAPHLEGCFVGAVIVAYPFRRVRVASFEDLLDHTSNS